jgi:hypothetical protein
VTDVPQWRLEGDWFDVCKCTDERQPEALQSIFGGQAGGRPSSRAWNWAAARAEALTGPTTAAGQRVEVHNAPGAEVVPGQVATWGTATVDRADGFGFRWDWEGRSSKHFPFERSGP